MMAGYVALALVFALATFPLAVVLASSPPLVDDERNESGTAPGQRWAGWRISITIARKEPGEKAK